MFKLADGPAQDVRGLLHGFAVGAEEAGWSVKVGTIVGEASASVIAVGVLVGMAVGIDVSVGETVVLVGTAACVSATIVNAIATAVDCTSSAFTVGSTGVLPHALSNRLSMAIPAHVFCFIRLDIP
jgi:hypothetical protein